MKRIFTTLAMSIVTLLTMAQGWPSAYGGVMLQGFYWDSYDDSQWAKLQSQADDLASCFSLVWLPQSAYCGGGQSMGYDDLYWFTNYNSSFGTESQLRSLISTFKSKGIGAIADVVINHRKNVSTWFDFPAETYNGVTYQLQSTDICSNDDGGAAAAEAAIEGVTLGSNKDTGEDWGGMRDLDHNSANVQANVKAYLHMLLDDLGYTGFRYDMVKGYSGSFTGAYNSDASPEFSVGEYWDGNATAVYDWLNSTKVNGAVQSAAFDFPFRYTVRDAINNNDWGKLGGTSLATDAAYNRYGVTFIENHDTEYRDANSPQDPINKDTLAANAFMLAMPGTPCVFYKHWLKYEQDIKSMIAVRQLMGVTNTSAYSKTYPNSAACYANTTYGTNGNLMVVVGNTASYAPPVTQWTNVLSGYHYKYYISKEANTAWVDKAGGTYYNGVDVTLTAVTKTAGAQLVYTTDGTEPTASSTKTASGTKMKLTTSTTLKVGLLVGGVVSGVVTRQYDLVDFSPYTITVYVNTDNVGWGGVNYWTWGGDGSHAPANTTWPGDNTTTTTMANGKAWYGQTYTINTPTDFVDFVFSTGTGSPQTVDVTNVNQTSYFEVSTDKTGDKFNVNDVTGIMTGINDQPMDPDGSALVNVYGIDGTVVRAGVSQATALRGLKNGVYIVNGKKYVVR